MPSIEDTGISETNPPYDMLPERNNNTSSAREDKIARMRIHRKQAAQMTYYITKPEIGLSFKWLAIIARMRKVILP